MVDGHFESYGTKGLSGTVYTLFILNYLLESHIFPFHLYLRPLLELIGQHGPLGHEYAEDGQFFVQITLALDQNELLPSSVINIQEWMSVISFS